MTRALIVPPDGPMRQVDWDLSENADPAGLAVLQETVGGFIEPVSGPGWHAYVNEDGKAMRLRFNPRATIMALTFGWVLGNEMLRGVVVFLGTGDDEHEHDVPGELVDWVFSH